MKKQTKALLMIGVIALLIYVYLTHTNSPIENTEWSCENGKCYVTLTMKNAYNYPTINRVVLRAHRRKTHDLKAGGSGMVMVGEGYIDIALEANEKKEIVEMLSFNTSSRVDMLVVKNVGTKRTDS
jgi:hypothetical protein